MDHYSEKKEERHVINNVMLLPAVEIARLDSGALTCGASQGASTFAVDALRHLCLTSAKHYSYTAFARAQSTRLCRNKSNIFPIQF